MTEVLVVVASSIADLLLRSTFCMFLMAIIHKSWDAIPPIGFGTAFAITILAETLVIRTPTK